MMTAPPLPDPVLAHVRNLTSFAFFQCDKMGPGRRYHDTIVVKAELELTPGRLRPIGPAPIHLADVYWDAERPARSSLARAGDVVLTKPSTDVLVTGTARAAHARDRWDVALVVRDARRTLIRHALEVTGPRFWEHRALRGWTLTDPEPTNAVPIRYELAYGGAHGSVVHDANPSGLGFVDARALDRSARVPAPQWQLPAHPVGAMNGDAPLAGLGPIARSWGARSRYAGTYDAAWERRTREEAMAGLAPDYARDFDARFFQCAPASSIAPSYLRGDEHIGLSGLLPGDPFLTRLPGIAVRARIASEAGRWTDVALPLDTVHIDLDVARVETTWRLSLDHAHGIRAAILYEGSIDG